MTPYIDIIIFREKQTILLNGETRNQPAGNKSTKKIKKGLEKRPSLWFCGQTIGK
jgi:hypothetical protein